MSLARLLLILWSLVAMTACAAPAADAPVAAALIVKPRAESSADQVQRTVTAALGAGVPVRYVRPLAGGAHLIHLLSPATKAEVPRLIERLQASGRFEYVEPDTLLQRQ